jgi:hypothetical protein
VLNDVILARQLCKSIQNGQSKWDAREIMRADELQRYFAAEPDGSLVNKLIIRAFMSSGEYLQHKTPVSTLHIASNDTAAAARNRQQNAALAVLL